MTWKTEILTGLGLPATPEYITAVDRCNERAKAEEDVQREPEHLQQQRHQAVLVKMREEILAEVAKLQGR